MATLAERLVEAENAFHLLQIGQAVRVVVDQNGERIEYTVANSDRLTLYVKSLRDQIANAGVAPALERPMRSFFI